MKDSLTLKNKLQNLAAQQTDVLESLSSTVRKRVEALKEIQSQHDELEAKFFKERAALEAKYQKLYQPLYSKVLHDCYASYLQFHARSSCFLVQSLVNILFCP